jgi:hypothetical protein
MDFTETASTVEVSSVLTLDSPRAVAKALDSIETRLVHPVGERRRIGVRSFDAWRLDSDCVIQISGTWKALVASISVNKK